MIKVFLALITTPTPSFIFTFIAYGTNHFILVKTYFINNLFKSCPIKMNAQENNGNILTGNGQVQTHGQVQSQSQSQSQFGGGQAQSQSEQVQSEQDKPYEVQCSSTSKAVQMLKKNKVRGEIKLVDKKEEDPLESIRRFNLINEDAKKSYDTYVAKTKQRGKDMKNLMREAEAKYHLDLDQSKDIDVDSDPLSGYTNKDLGSDKIKDSGSDTDSSIDFTTSKPKTYKFKCKECNEELILKNYNRHIQSLKHKKNERLYNRNKIIESANEDGIKVTNEDIERKLDEQYSELDGIKFCDSCDMYLDNNTAFRKHVSTLKHRNNARLVNGEIVKNGSKFDCAICKKSLSQYSVDQHLKTKIYLDNVNPRRGFTDGKDKDIDKDITKDNTVDGYCTICNNIYNNKNEHNESDEHKENVNQKKLVDGQWRDKANELGLDHNMKHNQIIITSSNYEDPKFLNILVSLHNIHPHIQFNTFDVVKYTKPTDDKLEENEFTFRLMTRQHNGAHDLDLLNGELESRMQEQEMNQSGWSMKRFIKRTMYIRRSYSSGGCDTEIPFTSRYIL